MPAALNSFALAPLRLGSYAIAACTTLLCCLAAQHALATTAPITVAAVKPTQTEFATLQALDTRARQDMSRWLRETAAHDEHLMQKATNQLSIRMEHRLDVVVASYREFLSRHPNHSEAASSKELFRSDIAEDLESIRRWEAARAEDPESPTPWNQLAHALLHTGRTVDAFACFEKALSLNIDEAVHYFDFATAMLLHRTDAMSHFKLTEAELFSRVLIYYQHGMHTEPENYRIAADYAQTFYVIKPARPAAAIAAWEHALTLATDDAQRGEARTHLARYAIHAGRLNLARVHLDQVTEPALEPVKLPLLRRIEEASKARQAEPTATPARASE